MQLVGLERSLVVGHRSDGLQVWLIGGRDLMDFSGAVAGVYSSTFNANDISAYEIEAEDRTLLANSIFLAITTSKRDVIATLRLTQWTEGIRVPIEQEFGVSISKLMSDLQTPEGSVWHSGRLSMNKETLINAGFTRNYSLNLLKSIVQYGFQILTGDPAAIVIGEMDTMAIKAVSKIGIHCEKVGEPKYFMGSMTVPVMTRLANIRMLPYVESLQVRHTIGLPVGAEQARL